MEKISFRDNEPSKIFQPGHFLTLFHNSSLYADPCLQLADIEDSEYCLKFSNKEIKLSHKKNNLYFFSAYDNIIFGKKVIDGNHYILKSDKFTGKKSAGAVLRFSTSDHINTDVNFSDLKDVIFYHTVSSAVHKDSLIIFIGHLSSCKITHKNKKISIEYDAIANQFCIEKV